MKYQFLKWIILGISPYLFFTGCANPPKPENYAVNYARKKSDQYGFKKISIDPKEVKGFQAFFNENLASIEPGAKDIRVLDKIFIILKNGKLYYTYDIERKSFLYQHQKLEDESVVYQSENGTFSTNGLFNASRDNIKAARIGFPITVQAKDTDFQMKKTFTPSFYKNKNLIKEAKNGTKGAAGRNGHRRNSPGEKATDGENGQDGKPGHDGPDMRVEIREFASLFYEKTLVWLKISVSKKEYHFILHRDQQFEIRSIAGDGGDGGNGGHGGDGQIGAPGKNASCEGCPGGPGGKGGNGGDGGNGGNGGNGGDGGIIRVTFFTTNDFYQIIKPNIHFHSQAGRGGSAGLHGMGGKAGLGGPGGKGGPANKSKNIEEGENGPSGMKGLDGKYGLSGKSGKNGESKAPVINQVESYKPYQ